MRVFIAIEFENEVKDFLALIQQRLQAFCTKGNFSRRENFHLTLRFIGEVEEAKLQSIRTAISKVAGGAKSFSLELGGMGQFPKGKRSVVWVGVNAELQLQGLYRDLEGALEQQGFARESRGYNPHITLAREVDKEQVEKAIGTVEAGSITQRVRAISLMQSTREAGRLVYKPLFRQEIGEPFKAAPYCGQTLSNSSFPGGTTY